MSTEQHSAENDAPVTHYKCPDCDAEPGQNCTGPGTGWHLSRWDLMWDSRVIPPAMTTPTPTPAAPSRRAEVNGEGA